VLAEVGGTEGQSVSCQGFDIRLSRRQVRNVMAWIKYLSYSGYNRPVLSLKDLITEHFVMVRYSWQVRKRSKGVIFPAPLLTFVPGF